MKIGDSTRFPLADVLVNIAASYHHLEGERNTRHDSNCSNWPNKCPSGCDLNYRENSKIRNSKVCFKGHFKFVWKFTPTTISCYTVLFFAQHVGNMFRSEYLCLLQTFPSFCRCVLPDSCTGEAPSAKEMYTNLEGGVSFQEGISKISNSLTRATWTVS